MDDRVGPCAERLIDFNESQRLARLHAAINQLTAFMPEESVYITLHCLLSNMETMIKTDGISSITLRIEGNPVVTVPFLESHDTATGE